MSERELLRDYAREDVMITLGTNPETGEAIVAPFAARGELAGKAFGALQDILTEVESEEETGGTVLALDDIRAVLRKALE